MSGATKKEADPCGTPYVTHPELTEFGERLRTDLRGDISRVEAGVGHLKNDLIAEIRTQRQESKDPWRSLLAASGTVATVLLTVMYLYVRSETAGLEARTEMSEAAAERREERLIQSLIDNARQDEAVRWLKTGKGGTP